MYRRLEKKIDPFAPFDEDQTPPATVAAFSWHYLKPIKSWFVILFIASLVVGLFESSLYVLMGWLVDLLAHATPDRFWADHGNTLLVVGGVVLFMRPILHFMHEAITNQIIVAQSTNMIRWRTHVYTLGHALSYFQADFAGRLANRITQAGSAIREIAVTVLDTLLYVAIFAFIALGMFSSVSPWLALPMGLWIIGYVALLNFFVPRARERSVKVADARSVLVGRVVDSYTNILTVKLFARGAEERSAVRDALSAHTQAFLHSFRLITSVSGILAIMNSILLVSTGALSVTLWMRGAMTSGEAAAGLALVMRILAMSGWVMQTVRGVFENIGIVQESMETIARPHGIVDAPVAPALQVAKGEVRFEDVSFHYGKEDGVIERLNLTIRAGEKVGLVGTSGAGKTTITSLLLRLHDVEGGRILVDGQDISKVSQDSLRSSIAVVTQDTSLLHRSIRDNIAYGRPGSPEQDIEEAARLAHAHDFIMQLEDHRGRRGYDAHVGERGVKLSGGQRQRVAIARVILKDAPILVLDEATSALDSEVEAAIQESLSTLMEGKTVLAIAHRLSTIAALDRLIVIERGQIVEEGSHAELLKRDGLYARLWRRQSGGFLGAEETAVI
ncbi:ABC transporter ATP-binding protein [Microvirga terricola]|uniref:ABC transporter ATP-binding protein n=1 Tax=Microvirga terricola TaxID=2719797 RepID=A0ABX0V8R6_9HYPH|nr:ABC transporter ATP-binding protein [Microvirga terricola]NIX76238.1 ABC transporter ATP-binding protein [Microvirga terricola]